MIPFEVWVDADSCPIPVRELIVRFALRLGISTYFVANRTIPLPRAAKASDLIKMILADNTEGAADNLIIAQVKSDDVVITRDIPLAARLLERNITVINDRGRLFTAETIREQVSIRNFNYELAQVGVVAQRYHALTQKDITNFANCFDRELQRKLHKT